MRFEERYSLSYVPVNCDTQLPVAVYYGAELCQTDLVYPDVAVSAIAMTPVLTTAVERTQLCNQLCFKALSCLPAVISFVFLTKVCPMKTILVLVVMSLPV